MNQFGEQLKMIMFITEILSMKALFLKSKINIPSIIAK